VARDPRWQEIGCRLGQKGAEEGDVGQPAAVDGVGDGCVELPDRSGLSSAT